MVRKVSLVCSGFVCGFRGLRNLWARALKFKLLRPNGNLTFRDLLQTDGIGTGREFEDCFFFCLLTCSCTECYLLAVHYRAISHRHVIFSFSRKMIIFFLGFSLGLVLVVIVRYSYALYVCFLVHYCTTSSIMEIYGLRKR